MPPSTYDFAIIGTGFGASISAMRLTEKGYSVLMIEKGLRFRDQDFPETNMQFWKYLWASAFRCFGILEISLLKGMMVLHGTGVGGGSLGYANVLEIPTAETFATPAWNKPLAWGEILAPHYATARRMLGATQNPRLWPADEVLQGIALELGQESSFRKTEVGVYFGQEEVTAPDPYFDGAGPERTGCQFCGGCMVGCRHNSKNTLPKNYLYFAEKQGAKVISGHKVQEIRPIKSDAGQFDADRARYEVILRSSVKPLGSKPQIVKARNVIVGAGVLGTLELLLKCRDQSKSLPDLSPHLGERVRTNSEALLGSVSRDPHEVYSKGIAITSIFNTDPATRIEPVRYPDGSDLMRIMAAPLISNGHAIPKRIIKSIGWILTHPLDFLRAQLLPGWARKTTILLVMQNLDNRLNVRLGRSLMTLFRKGLVAESEPGYLVNPRIDAGHAVTRKFAASTNGIPMGSLGENLLDVPTTAHILGGCPIGSDASAGVIGTDFQVHNYPGLYIVDGSVIPANPGVNPSLTIAALAEYAMTQIPQKSNS